MLSKYLIHLTSEESLLLSLCRLSFTDRSKIEIRKLLLQIKDWDCFINLANEHGVIALCWKNIIELEAESFLPPESLEKLHKGYLSSLARNARLFQLFQEVHTLGGESGIEIIPIKGIALEKTIYGDIGLRQMNDIDILVKKEDAIRLRKLMISKGFESIPIISPLHEMILPAYGKHLPEMYKNGIAVEIHFRLFEEKEYSLTEQFFKTAKSDHHLQNIMIPDPGLHFIYLVKHLCSHEMKGMSQLRLYIDLLELLLSDNKLFTVPDIGGFITRTGIERNLSEKLFILKEFLYLQVSEELEKYILINNSEELSENFIHFLRYPKKKNQAGNSDSLFKPMKYLKTLNEKILFLTGFLFPSLTFMKYRYSIKSMLVVLLYYPVRWVCLFKIVFLKYIVSLKCNIINKFH